MSGTCQLPIHRASKSAAHPIKFHQGSGYVAKYLDTFKARQEAGTGSRTLLPLLDRRSQKMDLVPFRALTGEKVKTTASFRRIFKN